MSALRRGFFTLVAFVAWAAPSPLFAQQPAPPPAPASSEVVPPKPLAPLVAAYPEGASGDARVMLVVKVNRDGSVRSAELKEGEEPFASAALEATKAFRFEPATRDGKAIAAAIRVEIAFAAPKPEPPVGPVPAAPSAPEEKPKSPPLPKPIDITVSGEKPPPGAVSMSRAEVRLLPGAFGDPFRAVEMLPGVSPIASGVPFFYVRGAPPGNVGYYLDGIRVPLLYHLGLGPSVVNPALIDKVDLYSGGYPARFGRFAGGIVSGETREPMGVFRSEGNVRLVDAGGMVEAPFAGGRGSAMVGGRYSYTALLLSLVQSAVDVRYWDYQARLSYDVTPRDRVGVFVFGSYDFLGQKLEEGGTQTLFDTTFHRVDLRYDHRFGRDSVIRQALTLGYDQTRLDRGRYAEDRMLGARTEITHRLSDRVLLRAGADAYLDDNRVDLDRGDGDINFTSLFRPRLDLSAGARADVVIEVQPGFELTPGLRVDWYGSRGSTALGVDPRLSARVSVTPWLRWVPAVGLATQPPSFLVPGPGFSVGLRGGLQRSAQASAGVELDLPLEVTATATGFYNTFYDMTDPLGTHASSASDFGQSFRLRSKGSSVGLELVLRRRLSRRLGGFVSYTLSRSTRIVSRPVLVGELPYTRFGHLHTRFLSTFDRTHVLNAAVSYDFGKGYRAGGRVVVYSGYPKVVSGPPPNFAPIVTDERLPAFFRLDLRFEKKWVIKSGWLSFVAEVQNATLSKEVLGVDCERGPCVEQEIGPVTIPSIGLEGGF